MTVNLVSGWASVLLQEFVSDEPYQFYREGWARSSGRSLTGALKIEGGNYSPKRRWDLAYKVSAFERYNLEEMVVNQRLYPILLTDEISNYFGFPVWIDLEGKWATWIADDWWLVQLTAREV